MAKVYPKISHYLIKEFLKAVVEVSIVELIALFVTFGAESFVKGPTILLTDGIQNLRLDGLLTLIAITHGNLGGLMKLTRCPEQMKERVRNLDMKKSTDSWNKIRDLRHTLIQYLLQQNRSGTGEDETIEKEEDVRRHVGGMPLLTDLSELGYENRSLGVDQRSHGVRDSDLWTSSHLNLISAVDGSTLNWCEQRTLRELMSEDLLFAKISEPEMTVINFDDHFRDRMGEVERGHVEVFPKLWNLRPYDKTNGEITRVPRLTAAYHKVREGTKDWGDYERLPEAIPFIRGMLLGAVSVVQTPRLRAFETNERRVSNFEATMDTYFVGRNAAVLQYTRFAYMDQATRRRISNAATPKPGRFDEEWAGLGLAPMKIRGRTELPEASLILNSVKSEMKVVGTLQTRTFLAPFGCEEINMEKRKIDRPVHCSYLNSQKKPAMMKKDHRARTKINQKERTNREEAVKPKNPCNRIKLVGKTTGHQQEEYPAWITISSVILRSMQIRWRQLGQWMSAPRHCSLRQPSWK